MPSTLICSQGSVTVEASNRVEACEQVGRLGSMGSSTAPHLHFGIVDRARFLR